jgi:hypothetical protein
MLAGQSHSISLGPNLLPRLKVSVTFSTFIPNIGIFAYQITAHNPFSAGSNELEAILMGSVLHPRILSIMFRQAQEGPVTTSTQITPAAKC